MEEEVKKWLKKAKREIDTAEYLFKGKKYNEASLFCQQSVEKALKALLLKKTKKIIKIHDLVKLGELVNLDPELKSECERLTFVYVDLRYPDTGTEEYLEEETRSDIESCKRILRWVEKNI